MLSRAGNPNLRAGSTILIDPPFDSQDDPSQWKHTKFTPITYVEVGDYRALAPQFFREVMFGWARLLQEEGLMRDVDPDIQNVFA